MKITVKHKRKPGDEGKCPENYGDGWSGCWVEDATQYEGFTFIGYMEWRNASYEFDMTGVWRRDSDNTLWTADDSGCSCPIPWERVHDFERLFSIDPLIQRYVKESGEEYSRFDPGPKKDEWDAFLQKVRDAFDELKTRVPEGWD